MTAPMNIKRGWIALLPVMAVSVMLGCTVPFTCKGGDLAKAEQLVAAMSGWDPVTTRRIVKQMESITNEFYQLDDVKRRPPSVSVKDVDGVGAVRFLLDGDGNLVKIRLSGLNWESLMSLRSDGTVGSVSMIRPEEELDVYLWPDKVSMYRTRRDDVEVRVYDNDGNLKKSMTEKCDGPVRDFGTRYADRLVMLVCGTGSDVAKALREKVAEWRADMEGGLYGNTVTNDAQVIVKLPDDRLAICRRYPGGAISRVVFRSSLIPIGVHGHSGGDCMTVNFSSSGAVEKVLVQIPSRNMRCEIDYRENGGLKSIIRSSRTGTILRSYSEDGSLICEGSNSVDFQNF